MGGFNLRFKILTKFWFRSPISLILLPLLPLSIYATFVMTEDTPNELTSRYFENIAVLILILVLFWAFSLDYNSGFIKQIESYPIKMLYLLFERLTISFIFFYIIMIVICMIFQLLDTVGTWSVLIFLTPVYFCVGLLFLTGTILGGNLVGLILSLLFWVTSLLISGILGEYSPIIVHFPNVFRFILDYNLDISNKWIIFNRVFYFSIGLLLLIFNLLIFYRKKRL